jgi:hypothetical protein
VDVGLLDHLLVGGDGRYFSFREVRGPWTDDMHRAADDVGSHTGHHVRVMVLRSLNQGTGRPQATWPSRRFMETQWQPLVLPALKRSTQHGYKHVLRKHVFPYWRSWRLNLPFLREG